MAQSSTQMAHPLDSFGYLRVHCRRALTLLELVIVIGLLVMMAGVGLFSSISFWKKYQLDESARAVSHFLEQVEMLAILTQADLELEFVSTAEGVWIYLKGGTPLALPKAATSLWLPGVHRLESALAGRSIQEPSLLWSSGQSLQVLELKIQSSAGERQVRYICPIQEKKKLSFQKPQEDFFQLSTRVLV